MNRKLAVTFAILTFALGIVGFAYAHWSDILVINGTVSTGNVDAQLSYEVWFSNDNYKDTNGDEQPDWEVATCDCSLEDDTLNITINNVYPCLTVLIIIDIHNTGSIPIGIYNISDIDWDENMEVIANGIDCCDCGWYGATPWQIDPCNTTYFWILIHFGEATPQGITGHGSITVELANWNEVTIGPEDFPDPREPSTEGLYRSCSSS